MSEKLFFSQKLIDSWCESGKVRFEGNTLTIETTSGVREYDLTQAARVLHVAGGGDDPHGIVGAVRTNTDLEALGADLYLDSLILKDTAYDVEPGFVAVRNEDEKSLDELLTEYLLKTLI